MSLLMVAYRRAEVSSNLAARDGRKLV